MRWLVLAVLASGCGRFAFDTLEPIEVCESGAQDDGSIRLCTADDLAALATSPDQWGGTFVLGADIDLAGTTLELIGTEQQPFTGVLDGDGRTIRNLVIDRPTEDRVGLVGWAAGRARVANLRVVDAQVTGNREVGILVGYAIGSLLVEDVTVTGIVRGRSQVGGVAGYAECYAAMGCTGLVFQRITGDIDVAAQGSTYPDGRSAAGILGGTYSEVSDTEHGAFIDLDVAGKVAGSVYVGGIVGDAELVRLTRCNSSASITADTDAGGLFGSSVFLSTEIFDSHTSGDVSCRSMCGGAVGFLQGSAYRTSSTARVQCIEDSCGGLIGYLEGDCHECAASGDVSGTTQVGGLMGHAWSSPMHSVRDSYASGTVTGTDEVGGFIGSLGSTRVARSYSTSAVNGTSSVGGLFGSIDGTNHAVSDSFYFGSVTGNTSTSTVDWLIGSASVAINQTNTHAGGGCANVMPCTGTPTLGSAQLLYMTTTAPLDAWDFATIWEPHATTFPTLRNVPLP